MNSRIIRRRFGFLLSPDDTYGAGADPPPWVTPFWERVKTLFWLAVGVAMAVSLGQLI
jgi:hypothetical protein